MSLIQNIFKSFFGDKSTKDIKRMMPIVAQVNAEFAKLKNISNDDLRALSQKLRQDLKEAVKKQEEQLSDYKHQLDSSATLTVKEQETLYDNIEETEKQIREILKDKLNEILPQAFAIIKDTARRFAENEEIEVTATDFDRELATRFDSIRIENDKAYYNHTWRAGGNL
ncbi:MAG: preprotein translocase subunit SecA, partial [Bacteroidales bacterium]|nr:preprotein translocase subunit SecA [Bacteroidales bacterium]